MSTRFLRRTVSARDPLALLERMLNRTTLSTKRIVHGQIIGRQHISTTLVCVNRDDMGVIYAVIRHHLRRARCIRFVDERLNSNAQLASVILHIPSTGVGCVFWITVDTSKTQNADSSR